MITNPYGKTAPVNGDKVNVQTFISHPAHHQLKSFAPFKGQTSIILNNLIANLLHDIDQLTRGTYTAIDHDAILTVLLERRPLSTGQYDRLRGTTVGPACPAEPFVQNAGGSASVRGGTQGDPEIASNHASDARHGERGTTKTPARPRSSRGKKQEA